jgi:hypothetical protein
LGKKNRWIAKSIHPPRILFGLNFTINRHPMGI